MFTNNPKRIERWIWARMPEYAELPKREDREWPSCLELNMLEGRTEIPHTIEVIAGYIAKRNELILKARANAHATEYASYLLERAYYYDALAYQWASHSPIITALDGAVIPTPPIPPVRKEKEEIEGHYEVCVWQGNVYPRFKSIHDNTVYADDILDTADTLEEAIQLVDQYQEEFDNEEEGE